MLHLIFDALKIRLLPEAFYTPRLTSRHDFGGFGTYKEMLQFTAVPDEGETYSVYRYQRSMFVHDRGQPVETLLATGLSSNDAQDMARNAYAAALSTAREQRDQSPEPGRFGIAMDHVRPARDTFCWRAIHQHSQAMATPPKMHFPLH